MIGVIKCGDCNKSLFNVSFTENGKLEFTFKQTKCPFCGGHSFEKTFTGPLSIGPIGMDESVSPTTIDNIDSISSTIFEVKVKKR